MRKISLVGLGLGVVLGLAVGLLAGSWIFWLGTGLAAGILIGSVSARRRQIQVASVRGELKP